jgi:hypothetical protein
MVTSRVLAWREGPRDDIPVEEIDALIKWLMGKAVKAVTSSRASLSIAATTGKRGSSLVAIWWKVWSTNPLERVNKEIPVLEWCKAGLPPPPAEHGYIHVPSTHRPTSAHSLAETRCRRS